MKNILLVLFILISITATAQRRNKKVSEMPTAVNLTNSFVPIIQDSSGSYVNRKYPGSSFGGGGTYTSSNGITLTGSDFKLGGTLTENTTIESAGHSLGISQQTDGNVSTSTIFYSEVYTPDFKHYQIINNEINPNNINDDKIYIHVKGGIFEIKTGLYSELNTTERLKIDSVGNVSFPNNTSFTINGNAIGTNTAGVLTDAATIDLTATKHTLATSAATRTFTISYTGDDITIEVTLSNTAATYTFPAGSLCISEGVASGDNTVGLAGVSGDKYIIGVKKIGSVYYVAVKNFGQ